jgi:pterin-4a-carbinolamine dehydratase
MDARQIQGAFRFAHFHAAKGFTRGAGNRAPAQRHHNRTSETQPSNGICSSASAHDK